MRYTTHSLVVFSVLLVCCGQSEAHGRRSGIGIYGAIGLYRPGAAPVYSVPYSSPGFYSAPGYAVSSCYSAPAFSPMAYSAPMMSYSAPSCGYSAPMMSYSAPSCYSAPAAPMMAYSAPAYSAPVYSAPGGSCYGGYSAPYLASGGYSAPQEAFFPFGMGGGLGSVTSAIEIIKQVLDLRTKIAPRGEGDSASSKAVADLKTDVESIKKELDKLKVADVEEVTKRLDALTNVVKNLPLIQKTAIRKAFDEAKIDGKPIDDDSKQKIKEVLDKTFDEIKDDLELLKKAENE